MADERSQERTEEATPRRREEARERGQVAMSADLGQAILLLTGALVLWFSSMQLAKMMVQLMRYEIQSGAYREFTIQHATAMMRILAGRLATGLVPIFVTLMVVAIGVSAAQVGLRVTTEPLNFNWSKLSIPKGWSRIFSMRSAVRGILMIAKLSIGLGVLMGFIWSNREYYSALGRQSLGDSVVTTWSSGLTISFVVGGTLLAIGLVDYLFQRWQHEQDLKMSRQDIRDEHKREEGDPQIRAQRRRMAREVNRLRMLRAVPESTVVLTNPTHIAIALQYDRNAMEAPRVVAKGTDAFAKRIAAVARKHGVPVLERKPLARALYASVEVDQEIPPNLYRAVAEILAHLQNLREAG